MKFLVYISCIFLAKKKEIIGILSYHKISFLHFGQLDLPATTPLSLGNLTIQTFAKLPHRPPNINIKSISTNL